MRTLKLFWERSKQALIELHVHKPTKEGLRWLKRNAREIVPRLRGLRVGDCHGSVDPHCLFAFPAPHLERLVYTHLVGQEIPDNLPLFAGDTPKLRKLILCQYEVWPSQSMCNLTHLYLSNQHSSLQLDVAEFSEVLRRCPDLEELYIVEAGPSVGAELNGQSVRLPRLRRLALHTKSPILEHFVVSCFVLVDPITIVFSESTIPSLSGVEESELDQHKSAVSSFIGRFNFKRVFLSTNPNDYNRRITLTSKTSAMTFQWSDYDRRKEIFTQLFRLASWGHVEEFHFEVGSKLHDILPHPLSEFISTTQAISFLSIIPRKYADNLTHFIPLIRNPKLTHLAILLPFQTDAIRHFQEDWWVALKTALKEKSLEGSPLSVLSLKYASGFFSGHDFLRRASPTTQLVEDDSLWEMEMPEVSKKDVHPTWGDYRQFAVVDSDIWLPF